MKHMTYIKVVENCPRNRCTYNQASSVEICKKHEIENTCNKENGCKWSSNICHPNEECITSVTSQAKSSPYICCKKSEALECCSENYRSGNCSSKPCTQNGKSYKCRYTTNNGINSCYPENMDLTDMIICNDVGNKKCFANVTKTGFNCFT